MASVKKYLSLIYCVGFYLVVMVGDWTSSKLNNSDPNIDESNPFVRDAALRFVLHKAVVVDLLFFIGISLIAFAVFKAVNNLNFHLALTLSSVVFIYYSVGRLLNAVVPNFILHLHYFVAEPTKSVLFH